MCRGGVRREPELVQRWLERQRQLCREPERLERWSSRVLPLLLFSPVIWREFYLTVLFAIRPACVRFHPISVIELYSGHLV